MITNQPPTIPNFPSTPPVSQTQPNNQIGGHLSPVKDIFLKHLLNLSVFRNEHRQVVTGATIIDISSNRTVYSHNDETEHFAASVNKVPVSLLILEDLRSGKLQLNQTLTWQASDVRAGSGTYDQPGAPLQATLGDVVYDLLHNSGNTAVRILVNKALGGNANVNQRWSQKPELNHTYLIPLDSDRFYLGNTTTSDSLWALSALLANPDSYSDFMKDAMADNIFTDMGVRSQLKGNDYVVLVNKIGILDDPDGNNRHDVGLIYNTKTHKTYGYSFLTTAPYDESNSSATKRADKSLKEMGLYTLWYAGDRKERPQPNGDLPPSINSQPSRKVPTESRILY